MQCAIDPNTEDCNLGAAAVQSMDSVFQSAPATVQASYQSAHDDIMGQFNANYSWYSSWIPFNPTCSVVCNIGTQAEQLQQQIQRAMGQNPTPAGSPGGFDIGSTVNLLIIGAVLYLALPFLISTRR